METNGIVLNLAHKIHDMEIEIMNSRGRTIPEEDKIFNEYNEMGTMYVEMAQRLLAGLVLKA